MDEWLKLQSLVFPLIWLLRKCKENDVEFFNFGFIVPFVSLKSKAKENERKIYIHTLDSSHTLYTWNEALFLMLFFNLNLSIASEIT